MFNKNKYILEFFPSIKEKKIADFVSSKTEVINYDDKNYNYEDYIKIMNDFELKILDIAKREPIKAKVFPSVLRTLDSLYIVNKSTLTFKDLPYITFNEKTFSNIFGTIEQSYKMFNNNKNIINNILDKFESLLKEELDIALKKQTLKMIANIYELLFIDNIDDNKYLKELKSKIAKIVENNMDLLIDNIEEENKVNNKFYYLLLLLDIDEKIVNKKFKNVFVPVCYYNKNINNRHIVKSKKEFNYANENNIDIDKIETVVSLYIDLFKKTNTKKTTKEQHQMSIVYSKIKSVYEKIYLMQERNKENDIIFELTCNNIKNKKYIEDYFQTINCFGEIKSKKAFNNLILKYKS